MAANPNDYAVIVGIDRYRTEAGLDPLKGAVNDAKLFHEWVIDPEGGGLDPAHVTLVTSPEDGSLAPNVDGIEDPIWTFYQKANEGVRPVGRRLYLFMAGHGVNPIEGDDCSLVAANSHISPLRVLTGRVTAERVLKQPMFQEVVLFMACCRDVNASATYCNLPMPGEPLKDSRFLHGLAVKWSKRAVEKELPHPSDPAKPPLWQSVFSHALLKSLRSAVDNNGDVTSLSLKNTVKALVTTLLPPDDNRPPQFFMDEDLAPIVFKSRPLVAAAAIPAGSPDAGPGPVVQVAPGPGGPPAGREEAPAAGRAARRPRKRGGGSPRGAVEPAQPAVAAPMPAGLIPVEVTLSGGATAFEALDGETLAKLNPPMETLAAGTFRVFLKPSLYAFRIPGGQAKPVSVLGEAISVKL
jgi:hypothetical protein